MKLQRSRLGDIVIRIIGIPALMVVFALCVCPQPPISAFQAIDADSARRAGLIVMWRTQIQVDPTRDQVAEVHLHVHDDRSTSYFEIRYAGLRETVSFDDLDPRGIRFRDINPEDPSAGAREWAELRKEILEAEGQTDVVVELITVPRTTLYALSGSGGIHAIDAETGETRWKARIGTPYEPTIGIASNNTRVVAVRGSRVYCLDALTGNEIWSRLAQYAPGGGVAISDHFAYVTSVEGRLQMFPLNENGLPEKFFASSGPATDDPAVTATTVSWATERGYFNVARSDVVALQYRLQTNDEFQAAGTAVGGYLIANSTGGKVYALVEKQGSIAWEFAVGERLDKKPITLGKETALFITASANLLALNVDTGQIVEGWPKRVRNITDYVGTSENVMYFIDTLGRMVGLRRDSGARVSSMPLGQNMTVIPNTVTDRLYVADASGSLVCLRELANINPVVIGENFAIGNAAAEEQEKKRQEKPANPFETDTGKPEEKKPDDPFATDKKSDDPFRNEGKKDDDDPFDNG